MQNAKPNPATLSESPVKERLKCFAKIKCRSIAEFNEECGLGVNYVTSIRKHVTPEKLSLIQARFPDLNTDWLLYGKGSMLIGEDEMKNAPMMELPKNVWEEFRKMSDTINSQQKTISTQADTIMSQADSLNMILKKSKIEGAQILTEEPQK